MLCDFSANSLLILLLFLNCADEVIEMALINFINFRFVTKSKVQAPN